MAMSGFMVSEPSRGADTAASPPLVVRLLDNGVYEELTLVEPRNPRTWRASVPSGRQLPLERWIDAARFFEVVETSNGAPADAIYVSVEQDEAGRHLFINLGEASSQLREQAREPLGLYPEQTVKELRDADKAVMLYARAAAPLVEAPSDADLCPHGMRSNYSVCPEVSLGRTQKLILCDEATLCRNLPEERIFEHLSLIVNCHENSVTKDKYRIGSCVSVNPPSVICHAVHEWFGRDGKNMNQKNDEIQKAIWEALQTGSVAVHCLAGIHRAACITACHYLYRHYTLGHKDVPGTSAEIYRRLIKVRRHVQPAYEHVLRSYEAHLKAAQRGGL